MDSLVADKYMRMIEPLAIEIKLELLTKLPDDLRRNFGRPPAKVDKEKLLEELSGTWKDIDDELVDHIISNRNSSKRSIDFE